MKYYYHLNPNLMFAVEDDSDLEAVTGYPAEELVEMSEGWYLSVQNPGPGLILVWGPFGPDLDIAPITDFTSRNTEQRKNLYTQALNAIAAIAIRVLAGTSLTTEQQATIAASLAYIEALEAMTDLSMENPNWPVAP